MTSRPSAQPSHRKRCLKGFYGKRDAIECASAAEEKAAVHIVELHFVRALHRSCALVELPMSADFGHSHEVGVVEQKRIEHEIKTPGWGGRPYALPGSTGRRFVQIRFSRQEIAVQGELAEGDEWRRRVVPLRRDSHHPRAWQ